MENTVQNCVKSLQNGGVILYPTDTIWGLGCDVADTQAIRKIFELKKIANSRSLILLVSDVEQLFDCVSQVPAVAYDLMEAVDKPLTIIYPDAINAALNVAAEDGSVGIRVVHHDFCRDVIRALGRPIISTSANFTGQPSPLNFQSVSEEIKRAVDFIVDPVFDVFREVKASQIIKIDTSGMFSVIRD